MSSSKHLLNRYKENLTAYTSTENPESKALFLNTIRCLDGLIEENDKVLMRLAPEQIKMEERIAGLEILEFHVTYGDYFARELNQVKQHAFDAHIQNSEILHGYWTKIAEDLRHQKKLADNNSWNEPEEIATHTLLWDCSQSMQIDFDHLLTMVECYGDRNRRAHIPIDEHIQQRNYFDLAALLHRHEKALLYRPRNNLPDDAVRVLQYLVNNIKNKFFQVPIEAEDEPRHWIPLPSFFTSAADEDKRAEAKKTVIEKTIKRYLQSQKIQNKRVRSLERLLEPVESEKLEVDPLPELKAKNARIKKKFAKAKALEEEYRLAYALATAAAARYQEARDDFLAEGDDDKEDKENDRDKDKNSV